MKIQTKIGSKALVILKRMPIFILLSLLFNCNVTSSKNEIVEEKKNEEPNEMPMTSTYKYLALGDSYTIGQGVQEESRFPVQLARRLENDTIAEIQTDIIARTGWTTRNLLDAIAEENPETGNFDFITLLIGVNNQYQGLDIDIFRTELRLLIDLGINLLEGKKEQLFLVSIPDWGVTPFAGGRDRESIASEIDDYNTIKSEMAEEYGLSYIYITDLTRLAANDINLLAGDGLHPSGSLYAKWVERLLPKIKDAL